MSEMVSHENSVKEMVPHENSVKQMMPHENSVKQMVSHENSVKQMVPHDNSVKQMVSHENSVKQMVSHENSVKQMVSHENSVEEMVSNENSVEEMVNRRESTQSAKKKHDIQKYLSNKSNASHELRLQTRRQEVQAAHVMRDLTMKFGTRGISTKKNFLQGIEEELKKSMELCGCVDPEQAAQTEVDGTDNEMSMKCGNERPAAIVAQSSYIRHLMDLVHRETERAGCPPPSFERDSGFEAERKDYQKQTITDFQQGETFNFQEIAQDQITPDMIVEPEEKMIARLKIYSRAFSAIILHFAALRPILLDIKRNYDSVLALRERQMTELRFLKKSIAYKEQSMDQYMANLRFEGYGELCEVEKQSYILLRHIDKQDAAIKTMTEILAKLEVSLSEEHECRRDADDQKRMLVQEVNELRRKLQMPLRQEDGPQGSFVPGEVKVADETNDDDETETNA